jgi:hypothetical protein
MIQSAKLNTLTRWYSPSPANDDYQLEVDPAGCIAHACAHAHCRGGRVCAGDIARLGACNGYEWKAPSSSHEHYTVEEGCFGHDDLCAFSRADTRCSKVRRISRVDSEGSPRSENRIGGVIEGRSEGLPGKRGQEEREGATHLGQLRITEMLVFVVGESEGHGSRVR